MNYKIFIIEDNEDISELCREHLEKYDYIVKVCKDFKNIDEEILYFEPHLILLDINIPSFDGFHWCKKIREFSSVPIIFLSARTADSDQVLALLSGGDDYITKPFSFDVLMAKVQAQLRRSYGEYALLEKKGVECEGVFFDKSRLSMEYNGKETELTKNESILIGLFFEQYPEVISREELLKAIWGTDVFVEENTLNVTVSRLRKKLEEIESNITIRPIRGLGYKLEKL